MIRLILICMVFAAPGLLQQACTTIPTELKDAHIASPGEVLVNHSLQRKQLDNLDQRCRFSAFPVDPITTVKGPSGYGLDRRYEVARSVMIDMGASCLSGSVSQCQSIIEKNILAEACSYGQQI